MPHPQDTLLMSDHTIDLFAKPCDIAKRYEAQYRANQRFLTTVEPRQMGGVITHTLSRALITMGRPFNGALTFGFQIRNHTEEGGPRRIYYTGRSCLERLLKGSQSCAREIFQVRMEVKKVPSDPVAHPEHVNHVQPYMEWMETQNITWSALTSPARTFCYQLFTMHPSVLLVAVHQLAKTLDLYYEDRHMKYRVRLFAKPLKEDQAILSQYLNV